MQVVTELWALYFKTLIDFLPFPKDKCSKDRDNVINPV